MRRIGALAAMAALIGVCSCGPMPRPANVAEKEHPGLVDPKEACLQSYVNCYRERDKKQLDDLLAPDYYFHSAGWENVLPRETDIWSTGGLFDVCPILGLEVRKGEWTRVDDVRGKPCSNCWETTRGYIFVWSDGNGTAQASSGRMRFVVRGTNEHGGVRYQLRALEELEGGESHELVAPEASE